MATQTTAGKQLRGRPFKPGVSGNASGRPKGSRNRAAMMAEALSEADAVAITRAVVSKAKKGDMVAAKLVLDRLWPAPRGRAIPIALPEVKSARGITAALAAVIASMADGSLSPDEASAVVGVIEIQRRGLETMELEARLTVIEEHLKADEQQDL